MSRSVLAGDGAPPWGPELAAQASDPGAVGRLLSAIPLALQRHGWAGLDPDDLCARTDVEPSVFAAYFRSEQDCFLCAYRHHADRVIEAVRAAEGLDAECHVRATFAALLGFLAAEPAVAELIIVRVLEAGPAALAERDRTAAALSQVIAGRVLPGPGDRAAAGALRRSAGGAVAQLIYSWVASGRAEDLESLLPTCAYLALVASFEPCEAVALSGLAGVRD